MYKSLNKGWTPLSDLYKKLGKDKSNINKDLKNLNSNFKEKVGRDWIVYEPEFLKLLKEKLKYSFNEYLYDNNLITTKEIMDSDLKVLWKVCGNDYIKYCKFSNLEYTILD